MQQVSLVAKWDNTVAAATTTTLASEVNLKEIMLIYIKKSNQYQTRKMYVNFKEPL